MFNASMGFIGKRLRKGIKDRVCLNRSCMFLCGGCVGFFGR